MSARVPHTLVELFRDALQQVEADSRPLTPERADFIEYLRQRIREHESLDVSCQTADEVAGER